MAFGPIPDQETWQGTTGRTWTANGTDLILWGPPILNLLGDDPQTMTQGDPYVEAGAEAFDVNGVDITGDIITDSSAVDVDTPGDYPVTYTVTDSQDATTQDTRTVRVLDLDRPDVRDVLTGLLNAGLPDGIQVYSYAAEQVKLPAVVVGTMDWEPAVMGHLKHVNWTVKVKILFQRSKPRFNVYSLETFSIKVGQVLSEAGMAVEGFENEETEEVGGTPLLAGVLTVTYRATVED